MSTYKAIIQFDSYEDSYEEGEIGRGTWWSMTISDAKTKAELREAIERETYSDWAEIELNDEEEDNTGTVYVTAYMANADNEGEATPAEIEQWKQGKMRLWCVNCRIEVTEVIERKAVL